VLFTPFLFRPKFQPLEYKSMTWGSAKIEKLWLTTREIIFEVFQLM